MNFLWLGVATLCGFAVWVVVTHDLYWRRASKRFAELFPDGCLRCVAEDHDDEARARWMGWEHTQRGRCRKAKA